ncbi:glutamate racemase [Bombella saccharophila]|uniref:Glutamate racemase n=1 Tax=Bombella saccharophila TaxID=2967338 RepID=A0ABT3W699_9PROT|nr:aspartate/glutamate racemase family protein [Bombella saccharophila]MCX5614223.1 aspartate/glutamate racemase family protein [Bombella saccharophila]
MPNTSPPRILVFDSGIGGLGVVQALRSLAPSLTLDYLADTALFPYGEQDDDFLRERITQLICHACALLQPTLVIIACNTASTLALAPLRETLTLPIVGCVPPIRWAGRVSKTRTIGLLATSATARRPYLAQLHHDYAADCKLIIHGSRHLATMAERAFRGEILEPESVQHELAALFEQPDGSDIDAIGLGCTHYTFLMPYFQRLGPPGMMWLDPAPAVAQQALRRLSDVTEGPLTAVPSTPPDRFFLTAPPPHGADLAQHIAWLGFTNGWQLLP